MTETVPHTATVASVRNYNRKIIEMAEASAEAAFELARELANAKAPLDIVQLWTSHTRRQFEILSKQTLELTTLGQKIAGESIEPIARSLDQGLKKAS
ncbi:MAG: phasin family protein [Xanthobacteraceae bacterium]